MTEQFDVFISHSHVDEHRARKLRDRLEKWGVSAYIDTNDVALSELPSAEVANRLVEKLRRCRLMIFAFSKEATTSRWMPWELGLAHGVIGRVVLWPFAKDAVAAVAMQEYLQLYETLEPTTARNRLSDLLDAARNAAVRPANLHMMRDLAGDTMGKVPDFNNPMVAAEFMMNGPMQLYLAWANELLKLTRTR